MEKIDYVREFVRKINPDYKVSLGEVFEVDIEEEEVFVTFNSNKDEEDMFQRFLLKDFGRTFNPFVISLLHEVAHIETYEEELDDDRTLVYGLLKMDFDAGKSDVEKYNELYFHIPAEFDATSWAVEYYETHLQECMDLAKRIEIDF